VIAQTCDRLAVLYGGRVAESGSTRELFTHPQHPYTRGLMNAIPHPGTRGRKMATIPGTVPTNPGALSGCPFTPRCEFAMDRCNLEVPRRYALGENHSSACFLAEPKP
jgi:peptide/nickel transport system ATP-binding protein